jgi:hypothetical protein
MICPRCGAQIEDPRKFCGDCGSSLPWKCSSCGSENAPGKRFCGECGAASETKPRMPQQSPTSVSLPERRQLTVMFADMVDSTALGARLDPEDLRSVISSYHGAVTGLVARFEGFVARYMGDGVLIYFGYPQAHEDDPSRSCDRRSNRQAEHHCGPSGHAANPHRHSQRTCGSRGSHWLRCLP